MFDEIAVNDYMSTLAITKGTLPAGKYSILIQSESFQGAKMHPEFSKAALIIYKAGLSCPE